MPARWDEPLRYRLTGPSSLSRRDNVMPSRIGHFVTESRRLARRDPRRVHSFHSLFTMPGPTKAAIAVPSKDPTRKEKDEKDDAASKKKPDEKEGEELVR